MTNAKNKNIISHHRKYYPVISNTHFSLIRRSHLSARDKIPRHRKDPLHLLNDPMRLFFIQTADIFYYRFLISDIKCQETSLILSTK